MREEPKGKSTARSRREKENWEFGELGRLLPLPSAITSQLDKASVVRLTTSYLNLRNVFPNGFGSWWHTPVQAPSHDLRPPPPVLHEFGSHFMQTLEGFLIVISPTGKVMYISETASVHLGLSQVELIGNSMYDYIHQGDHAELFEVLQGEPAQNFAHLIDAGLEEFEVERVFFLRMKCVLAKRNAGLTDHGYKVQRKWVEVIHCSGYVKLKHSNNLEAGEAGVVENLGLVASAYTLPPSSVTELRLSPYMFMFRASMDLKLVFLDSRVSELMGYELSELLDRSLYDLIHAADIDGLRQAHKTLLSKHQVTTNYYRMLAKEGGWVWVQSQLALIHVPRASRPTCIVAISHTITGGECPGLVLHSLQTANPSVRAPVDPSQHTLGAYSEHFYGPNGDPPTTGTGIRSGLGGMHLVQPPAYPGGSEAMEYGAIRGLRRKRPPFQYKDPHTGERRYCLREGEPPSTSAHPFPLQGPPPQMPPPLPPPPYSNEFTSRSSVIVYDPNNQ